MYIMGKNSCREYLDKNKKVLNCYIDKNFSDENILSIIEKRNIRVKTLTKFEIDRIVKGNNQGIILNVPDYRYFDFKNEIEKDIDLVLILDHLEDPHNFGAIVRTAAATGVDLIIIPNRRSVEVNETVYKTSSGCVDKTKISMVANINDTIKKLKDKGFWIVGTEMNGEDYCQIDYKGKIAIVVGNESNGISDLVLKNCDFKVKIPLLNAVESLNVSVASGVILYEVLKQRK